MTTNTGASIVYKLFYKRIILELISFSLIVFGFRKATLGGDGRTYEVWVILGHVYGLFAGFHAIDKNFDIWTHSSKKLKELFNCINSLHPTIKFTMDYSATFHFMLNDT